MANFATHGELIEHGKARYQDKPDNNMSYYALLRDNNGEERKLWGVGIQDAINNANIQNGDKITLVDRGNKAVQVPDPKNEGQFINANRRTWEAEIYEPELKLENSIEPILEHEIQAPVATKDIVKGDVHEVEDSELDDNLKRIQNLPQNLENNYIAITKNRLLKDAKVNFYEKEDTKSIAFEDRNSTLNTSRNDEKTVKAMLDLAQSKGWSAINIKGEQEFKRQMWLEANVRGMETRGYKPTEQDLAELQARQLNRTDNNISNDEVRSKQIEAEKAELAGASKTAVLEDILVNEEQKEVVGAELVNEGQAIAPEVPVTPQPVEEARKSPAQIYRENPDFDQNITDDQLQKLEADMRADFEKNFQESNVDYSEADVDELINDNYSDFAKDIAVQNKVDTIKQSPEYATAQKALLDASANSQNWTKEALQDNFDNRVRTHAKEWGTDVSNNELLVSARTSLSDVATHLPENDAILMQKNFENSLAGRGLEKTPMQQFEEDMSIRHIEQHLSVSNDTAKEIYHSEDFVMPNENEIRANLDPVAVREVMQDSFDSYEQAESRLVEAEYEQQLDDNLNAYIAKQSPEWWNNPNPEITTDMEQSQYERDVEVQEQNQLLNFEDDIDYAEEFYKNNKPMSPEEEDFYEKYGYGDEHEDMTNEQIEDYFDSDLQRFERNLESTQKKSNPEIQQDTDTKDRFFKPEDEKTLKEKVIDNGVSVGIAGVATGGVSAGVVAGAVVANEVHNHAIDKGYDIKEFATEKANEIKQNFNEVTTDVKQSLGLDNAKPEIKTEASMSHVTSDDNRYSFSELNAQNTNLGTQERFINGVVIMDNETGERYKLMNLAQIHEDRYNENGVYHDTPVQDIKEGEIYSVTEYYRDDKELVLGERNILDEDDKQVLNKLGIDPNSDFAKHFPDGGEYNKTQNQAVIDSLKPENIKNLVGKEPVRLPADLKQAVDTAKEVGFDSRTQALMISENLDRHSSFSQAGNDKELRVSEIADDFRRSIDPKDYDKLNQFIDKYSEKTGVDLSEFKQDLPAEDRSQNTAKLAVTDDFNSERAELNNPTQTEVIERNQQLFEDVAHKLGDKDASNIKGMREVIHAMYANQPDKLQNAIGKLDKAGIEVANDNIKLGDKSFEVKEMPKVEIHEPKQGNLDRGR